MEVFWTRGYEDTSVAALTEAMGINPPSLYAAFGSKEQLFAAALALYGELESHTRRALRDQPTARAAVAAVLLDNAAAYSEPGHPTGCLVVHAAASCSASSSGVRAQLAEARRTVEASIARRVERGVADGDVPAGADAEAIAAFYNTVLEGLSHRARDGAPREALESIANSALAAWDGLTGRAV